VRLKPDTPEITVAPGCWSRRLGERVLESYRYSVERSIGVCVVMAVFLTAKGRELKIVPCRVAREWYR